MPLAVTHVLLTIILVDLYRDYMAKHKRHFTLFTVLVAGIAGLLPDIDIPLTWLLALSGISAPALAHGGITHTPAFGALFLVPALILWHKKKRKAGMLFFVVAFGVFFHLLLDYVLGGGRSEGIMFFWPFAQETFRIHLLARFGSLDVPAALDAIILLAWLAHEELKHKIRDFV